MADTTEIDKKLTGDGPDQDKHFDPEQSNVLDMILQEDEILMKEISMSKFPELGSSPCTSRTTSRASRSLLQ